MVTLRGLLWALRNLLVMPRYFSNWYKLLIFPSIGILRDYNLKFYFPSLRDLAYDSYVLRENFFDHQYDWLNVLGRTVIDIGANMGDTAILFAYKGAKKVIAYEPYPYQYIKAKKNIALNHMENKIKIFRVGVSNNENEILIKDGYTDGSQSLNTSKEGIITKTITLSKVIEKYNPTILKSDCEGSEYEIIFSTPPNRLAQFRQMIIDYHNRGYRTLETYIQKAGFSIKRREYNNVSGMLKCMRKNRNVT